MAKKYITRNAKQTKIIGEKFAKNILKSGVKKSAVVLFLQGDLGAGKTTFAQGFARGLGIKEKITSPTFVIIKKFRISKKINISHSLRSQEVCYRYFYHFDCYRLNKSKEILDLGFEEIISDSQNIVAVEWPERISKILPRKIIKIKFNHLGKNQRRLTISE